MSFKLLQEQRGQLAAEIKRLAEAANTEKRDFTSEEQAQWEKVNKDYDATVRQLEVAQRAAEVAGQKFDFKPGTEDRKGDDGSRPAQITDETRDLALNAWARSQFDCDPSEREMEACKLLNFNPNRKAITFNLMRDSDHKKLQLRFQSTSPARFHEIQPEARANMSNTIPNTGGYLHPSNTFLNTLEVNMLAFGGMEQVAEVMTTTTGETISWPTADDTSNTGVQLGENTSIGSSVEPSFGQVRWGAHKFSSKPVLVPYELLQDSAFDIASMLGQMLGERLGRITNTKATTGTGADTFKGITNCSALGVTTASGTAITADEVLGLVHSVDPAYRNGSRLMFHDGILLYLRKLKDGEGRYLWQQGIGTAPDTFWSYPYTINQDMQSSVATGTKTILFGQFSKYKIRRVGGVRLYRMDQRYRDTDQDGFVAFLRQDGNLLTAGTAPVKHLLQA